MEEDVVLGECYLARVSGRLVPVEIVAEAPGGGWYGVGAWNLRPRRIRSADRLHEAVELMLGVDQRLPDMEMIDDYCRARWAAFLREPSQRFALLDGRHWYWSLWAARYHDGTPHVWLTAQDVRGRWVRDKARPWNRAAGPGTAAECLGCDAEDCGGPADSPWCETERVGKNSEGVGDGTA